MAKRRPGPEQIINKLREAAVLVAKDTKMPVVCRKRGVTEQSYYRWRKKYGGLRTARAKKLKDLEKENVRLKRPVADQALDISMLKEVAEGNFQARRRETELCIIWRQGSKFLSGGHAEWYANRGPPGGVS